MLRKILMTLMSVFLLPMVICAQVKVSGHVQDVQNNEPLIGASVILKSSPNIGTITDIDGNFILDVPTDGVLVVSYIGYTTQEVTVKGKSNINVLLKPETETLDEVVVVGYGAQKKVNVTGAVTQVKMDDAIGNRPVNSVADALIGNTPGVTFTDNSGEPGSGYTFNVRGTSSINGSSPLILVDGISMDISALNPNDIESVSVLKDASAAAVYGARAAFGVILITTKKANKEQKPQITFSGKFSFSQPQSLAERATPLETVQALRAANIKTATGGQILETWEQLLIDYNNDPSKYPDGYTMVDNLRYDLQETDATKDFISTGFQQIYDLAVSGGSEKIKYRISASYLNQDGVLVTNKDNYNRYNVSSFVSGEINSWLKAELTTFFTNSNKKDPYRLKFKDRDVWAQAVYLPSWAPLGGVEVDGEYYDYLTPRHMLERGVPSESKDNRVNMIGRLIFTPLPGLNITGEYSINKSNNTYSEYNKKIDDFYDTFTGTRLPANELYSSYLFQKSNNDYDALNLFATYNKDIAGHEFTIMGGMNYEHSYYEKLYASRANLISNELPSLSLATNTPTVSDAYKESAIFGLFYRLNYSYKGRYLFEASGRYDGSSKFPESNRFGFFPSFSAGWRLSEESFMKGIDWLSNLKVRASYGSIGNQNIDDYLFIPTMSTNKASWGVNGDKPLTINTPVLVRANFTWEQVNTTNIGLDWGFLNNRLNGSFDYFIRETKNMLGPGPDLPTTIGANSPMQNAANMRTNGWELQLNWADNVGEVSYRVGFNLSDAKSVITKYNNPTKSLSMDYYEGKELGEIWGYVSDRLYTVDDFVEGTLKETADGKLTGGTLKDGIPHFEGVNPNPGDMLFKYADENGLIWKSDNTADNPGSRRIIGNSTPRYNYGISLGANWKGFDLAVLFQGVGKRDLWVSNSYTMPFASGGFEYSFYKNLLDYWSIENQDSFYPRRYESASSPNTGANNQVQTKYLFDASYLDLKSVTLTYNLPVKMIKKVGLGNVAVYVNGENLLSWNHMPKGMHPDSKIRGEASGVTTGGLAYPVMRKFTFGVNLSF